MMVKLMFCPPRSNSFPDSSVMMKSMFLRVIRAQSKGSFPCELSMMFCPLSDVTGTFLMVVRPPFKSNVINVPRFGFLIVA